MNTTPKDFIVADAGSTKTTWFRIFPDGQRVFTITRGINPVLQDDASIRDIIEKEAFPRHLFDNAKDTPIYYYGAGCIPTQCHRMENLLSELTHCHSVEVRSDLWGAARALCGHEAGIACILGTGANSCKYDNNMSISKNVGAMAKSFANLRASNGYNRFKEGLKENLSHNDLGRSIYSGLMSFKQGIKETILDAGIFGEFNLEYMGPVDGHNIADLIQVLRVAEKHDGPVVVHVITRKGKGYRYCENDREGRWHGVGPFNIDTGKPLHGVPEGYVKWADLFSNTVSDFADTNKDIIALTPAMIQGSGLQNFFAKHPDRSFDCGITEEHSMTFAAGLAICGKRPYIPVYSSFLQRAYDQINHDICRMDLPVVIGIDHAGLVGDDGETHHGIFDIGLLRPVPNLILAQPRNGDEAQNLLYTAFHQNHPFAIRYPKGVVRKPEQNQFQEIRIGSWEKLSVTGNDKAYLLSYGPSVNTIYEKLVGNEIPVTVINCRFIKPMDEEMLREIAESEKPVLVYESDMLSGGLAEAILGWLCDNGLTMKLHRMGIGDHYVQQGAETRLRKEMHIDLNSIIDELNKII